MAFLMGLDRSSDATLGSIAPGELERLRQWANVRNAVVAWRLCGKMEEGFERLRICRRRRHVDRSASRRSVLSGAD
jgi:hypothetical protein